MENPTHSADTLPISTDDGAIFAPLLGFVVRLLLFVLVIAAFAIRIALEMGAKQLDRFLARVCAPQR